MSPTRGTTLVVLALLSGIAAAHAIDGVLAPGGSLAVAITADSPLVPLDDLPPFAFGSSRAVRGVLVPLAVTQPGLYRVELRSTSFDGLLVLRDEDGGLLDFDDDGLDGGLDAALVLPIDPDEPVELFAVALHGAVGTAQLTLQRVARLSAGRTDAPPELTRERARHKLAEEMLGTQSPMLLESLARYGIALSDQGEPVAACAVLERAIDLGVALELTGDVWLAIAAVRRADVLLAADDFVTARASYERALVLVEANVGPGHPDGVPALGGLARACKELGDYGAAREAYENAIATLSAARPDDLEGATLRINLAELLRVMGDLPAARRSLEHALTQLEEVLGEDHPDVASCRNNLGVLLAELGDREGARELYELALDTRERVLGPDHPHVSVTLGNLAELEFDTGDLTRARPLAERALAIREDALGPRHPDVAELLANLGRLLERQGDLVEARGHFERAFGVFEDVFGPDHPSAVDALADIARLSVEQGRFADARALLDRAIAGSRRHLLEQLTGLAESDALRLVGAAWSPLEMRLSPVLLGDDAETLSAYDGLLAWKAQVLRAIRRGRDRLRAELSDEALFAVDRLQHVTSELSRIASGDSSSDVELGELIAERNRLERSVSRDARGPSPDDVSWRAIRAALPEDGALVDLYVQRFVETTTSDSDSAPPTVSMTEAHVVAWVTRPDSEGPERIDLGLQSELGSAARTLLEPIASARGRSAARPPTSTSPSLDALLWTPLEPHLRGVERVFVSPDGVLASVPFEVLRGADGRYLVEDRGFLYLTDPTDLVRITRRAPSTRVGDLLVVGNVDFEHADEPEASVRDDEDPTRPASTPSPARLPVVARGDEARAKEARPAPASRGLRGARWDALAATGKEARDVADRHAAARVDGHRTLLSGSAASEEALKRLLPLATYVHLATHGYFEVDEPVSDGLQSTEGRTQASGPARASSDAEHLLGTYHPGLASGLVCAGANSDLPASRDDGYLTAEEVGWIDLGGVELVVLSACDTGLGRAQSGEGLLGLRRAFLAAGARSVLSSLWSVPDQETAEFMDRFYANLWQRGLGLHDALRTTQLEMLAEQRGRPDGRVRPVTWGAFVLDGDWR